MFRLSLTNLRRQKLRATLTIMGVMVGTAMVTTMVSVGIGVKRSIIAPLSKSEILTSITVRPFAINLSDFSLRDIGRRPERGPRERKIINDDTISALRKIPGVTTVYPNLRVPLTAQVGDNTALVTIEVLPDDGITEGLRRTLSHGTFWDASRRGCVLPSDKLSDLGIDGPEAALGREIVFSSPRRFFQSDESDNGDAKTITVAVIGVYSSEDLGMAGSRVLLPDREGRQVLSLAGTSSRTRSFRGRMSFGGTLPEGQYRGLTVKVGDLGQLTSVREQIDELGYGTITADDLVGIVDVVFVPIEVALGLIGCVGLIVAFFGIANTMVMSVLERTREIGILKALGARNRDVRRLFICEAAAIGLVGGILGVFASWGLGEILDMIAAGIMARTGDMDRNIDLFQITGALVLGSLAVALITAVVAGLWPAWRAASMEPVASLRYE